MMNEIQPPRNIGLDLVRVTETAALAAGRWVGSGDYAMAHFSTCRAMAEALDTLEMNGNVIFGEEDRLGTKSPLRTNQVVGTGNGPDVDVLVDPIDGTNLLIKGLPGAISVICVAPKETVWSPVPAKYMEKIIVDQQAAHVLVPECLDAPAAWTLALIARAKNKAVRDLSVVILDRVRHEDLIAEIRATGARILLRDEGDAEGALLAVTPDTGVDALMGIGGAAQGMMAACAARAQGGAMLARLAPQTEDEFKLLTEAGQDIHKIWNEKELVQSDQLFVAVTGITNSILLRGMRYFSDHASTYSLLIRSETGTRRFIRAEHAARV
jgi:fructose-1,6-bisphosphatase II